MDPFGMPNKLGSLGDALQTWLPWGHPTNVAPLGSPYKLGSLGDALQTWLPSGCPTDMGPFGMPYKLGSLGMPYKLGSLGAVLWQTNVSCSSHYIESQIQGLLKDLYDNYQG